MARFPSWQATAPRPKTSCLPHTTAAARKPVAERAAQVEHEMSVPGPGDQPGAVQDAEVLADRAGADAQPLSQFGRRGRLDEVVEDAGAGAAEQVGKGGR